MLADERSRRRLMRITCSHALCMIVRPNRRRRVSMTLRTCRLIPTASRARLPEMVGMAILSVMKVVTALEAKTRFGEVLEAAQRQPVSITRNGRPSVVIISAESYARRRRIARERLLGAMQRAGDHAASQGLNEDRLSQLLADES